MDVSVDTAVLNTVDCGEIKIKSAEDTKHRGSREHHVEMANNIERVVEQNVHTGVSDTHTGNSSRDEKEHKCECEQEGKLHNESAIYKRDASVHKFCSSGYGNHYG